MTNDLFPPYELICINCELEFVFHITGELGRCSFLCSESCAQQVRAEQGERTKRNNEWVKV